MLGTRLFEEIVNIFMTMMTAGDQVLTENERLFRLGKIGNGQKKKIPEEVKIGEKIATTVLQIVPLSHYRQVQLYHLVKPPNLRILRPLFY